MALHEKFERPRSHQKALDDLIGKAFADSRLTAQQKSVLICLAWHAKNRAGEAYPAQSTISDLTGVCVSLVGRAIKTLQQLGYIEKRDRHRKDGGKTSCLIVIHGMQYFPDDYKNLNKTTEGQGDTANKLSNVRSAAHTVGIGMRYGTKKEEYLKEDSFSHVPNVEGEREDFFNCSGRQPGQTPHVIDDLKPTSQVLLRFISYLSANRQSLLMEDYDAIQKFQMKPEFSAGVAAAKARMSEPELRRQVYLFMRKRPQMQRPAASQLDEIIMSLTKMPACVASLALRRIDDIYKSGWKIPPKADHFFKAVETELRQLTVFTNAQVCFDMASKIFEQRQKGRGLRADHETL
jgi:hypothetical protein